MLFPSKNNRDWDAFKIELQFPMTYAGCCRTLGYKPYDNRGGFGHKSILLGHLQDLLIARDAWWKRDNDWKPDYSTSDIKHCISVVNNKAHQNSVARDTNCILAFRTSELRDKFLETFRNLIEQCKELI